MRTAQHQRQSLVLVEVNPKSTPLIKRANEKIQSSKDPHLLGVHPTCILVRSEREGAQPPCAPLHGNHPAMCLRSDLPAESDGNDPGLSKTVSLRATLSPLSCCPLLCATVSATTAPSIQGET
ncbi:unnamed protein product [Pleuronectes platessa]|uniref:Uncharacterized protein n=1 Tax=Pleuronectes platessa TaxID=8262 RepID=A0A9N7VS47_PLEPL|nr:unnamed protein product [Pleuronectes platessa]